MGRDVRLVPGKKKERKKERVFHPDDVTVVYYTACDSEEIARVHSLSATAVSASVIDVGTGTRHQGFIRREIIIYVVMV